MTRSNSTLLALLGAALAAAAVVAWLFIGAEGEVAEQAQRGGAPEDVRAEQLEPRVEAPVSADPLEAPSSEREATTRESTKAPAAIVLAGFVRTAAGPAAEVDLIVTAARGAVRGEGAGTQVRDVTRERGAQRNYSGGAVCRSGADGAYRIDITKFVGARAPDANERAGSRSALWIKAVRIGELPREFEVSFPTPRDVLTATAPSELRADLELRAACVLRGTVVTQMPSDVQPQVALFELIDGAPRRQPVQVARCDAAHGEFELVAECGLEGVLVAWAEDLRPQSRVLRVGDGFGRFDFVLDRGAVVAGRVSLASEPVAGTLDFELALPDAIDCSLGESWLRWTGSEFEWTRVNATSDVLGSFEVAGLAPANYQVSIRGVRSGYALQLPPMTVVAPATGVELTVPLARVELTVFKSGERASRLAMQIQDVSNGGSAAAGFSTDDSGVVVLWLAEGSQVWVSEADSGARASSRKRVKIDNPGPGQSVQLRVDL